MPQATIDPVIKAARFIVDVQSVISREKAANIILTKPLKACTALKSWAMRIARRAGMAKAKVALARKLAVIMHRMLADGTPFTNQPA